MRIALLGNCTVDTIAGCLEQQADVEVESFWVRPGNETEALAFRDRLGDFDAVCAHRFPTGSAFSKDALAEAGIDAVSLPGTNFGGFHPDIVTIAGVRGPMGFMHSSIAVAGYLSSLPSHRCVRLFNRFVYASLGHFDHYAIELRRMLGSAQQLGFDLSPDVEFWPKPFVYDLQHPKFEVVASVAERLLARLGLPLRQTNWANPVTRAAADRTRFNVTWPVYPELALHLGMPPEEIVFRFTSGRTVELSLDAFVARSYEVYAGVDRRLLESTIAPQMPLFADILPSVARQRLERA